MQLTTDPLATTAQVEAVSEAIARSAFDWDRLTSGVAVSFGAPDAGVHDAYTTTFIDGGVDHAGRPDQARVVVKSDVIEYFAANNGPADPRFPTSGEHGAFDVIHHALGHVLAAKLNASQIQVIGTAFERNISDWNDDAALPWGQRVLESFAEMFKDVFLGDERMWDNRALPLPQQNLEMFLNVLREICPARLPTGHWEWAWPDGPWSWVGSEPPSAPYSLPLACEPFDSPEWPYTPDVRPRPRPTLKPTDIKWRIARL